MKSIHFTLAAIFLLISGISSAQCDDITARCAKNISQEFISDGQSYWAFVTPDDIAEFQSTLFGGNTYRVAACGAADGAVVFRLYDEQKNELFSSSQFGNAPYWDFVVENTMTVTIEATLDKTRTSDSACAVLLMGFRR
jgi:hypothetical protein